MVREGFQPRKDWGTTRRTLQNDIRARCDQLSRTEWHEKVTREDLGIIAKARARMFYNGEVLPVSIDNVQGLARVGVAIVIIEKEGGPEALKEAARDYGVALVDTQGRFTDYTMDLIEAAKMVSPYVVILTDYDIVGLETSKATKTETIRIGIDMDTVKWLRENGYPNLELSDIEEAYTPSIWTDDPYLSKYRIEFDSILAVTGAEVLWKFVKYKLEEIAKKEETEEGFNYVREEQPVIERPESK